MDIHEQEFNDKRCNNERMQITRKDAMSEKFWLTDTSQSAAAMVERGNRRDDGTNGRLCHRHHPIIVVVVAAVIMVTFCHSYGERDQERKKERRKMMMAIRYDIPSALFLPAKTTRETKKAPSIEKGKSY